MFLKDVFEQVKECSELTALTTSIDGKTERSPIQCEVEMGADGKVYRVKATFAVDCKAGQP